MKKLFKGIIILIAIVIIGAMVIFVTATISHKIESNKMEAPKKLGASLQVKVSYEPDGRCSTERPYFSDIKNNSQEVITHVKFSVIFKQSGYSGIVAQDDIQTNKIFKPNETHLLCLKPIYSHLLTAYTISTMTTELYVLNIEAFTEE